MKYTPEQTEIIVKTYNECAAKGMERQYIIEDIQFALQEAALVSEADYVELPSERSIVAKLSSLGIYKKAPYLNKNGELPKKKEVYIEEIARILGIEVEELDSLVKVNKNVLEMLVIKLTQ